MGEASFSSKRLTADVDLNLSDQSVSRNNNKFKGASEANYVKSNHKVDAACIPQIEPQLIGLSSARATQQWIAD